MKTNEKLEMYHIAYELVRKENYDVLYVNAENHEIWLEKKIKRKSNIIRFTYKSFDWANQLKSDIAHVLQRVDQLKKMLRRPVEVFNLYFSSQMPVDDWSNLKGSLQLKNNKSFKMKHYFLNDIHAEDVYEELFRDLHFDQVYMKQDEEDEIHDEEKIQKYQMMLMTHLYQKQREVKSLVSYGKPFITYILMALSIIGFLLLEMNGGSNNIDVLIQFGAKYNPAIVDGQWWRSISAMFLHIGAFHLFMNMLALYYLGSIVEKMYGSGRFLIIYFLAGISSSFTSFAFTINVSAGASGAIFGLFGALLFFGTIHKKIFLETIGRNIIVVVLINIVIGLIIPGIDISAHLGGLLAGFIVAAMVHLPKHKHRLLQITALFLFIFLQIGFMMYGVQTTEASPVYQLMEIEELIPQEEYEVVIEKATKALENPEDFEAEILFHRSYAYIHLDELDLAIDDLESSVKINEQLHQSFYNLAKLYELTGKNEQAKKAIKEAYHLKPENNDYKNAYEKIVGEKAK